MGSRLAPVWEWGSQGRQRVILWTWLVWRTLLRISYSQHVLGENVAISWPDRWRDVRNPCKALACPETGAIVNRCLFS